MSRFKGFTLVELMVIVALVAITATIAVPSFTNFIKKNELQAAANDVTRLLQYARNEAVNTRSPVAVNKDSSKHEWVVSVGSGERRVVLRVLSYNPAKIDFSTDLSSNQLTFNPYGAANKTSKISICREKDNETGYLLEVKRSGRIQLSTQGGAPKDCKV